MNSPVASTGQLIFPASATISPTGAIYELRPYACSEPGCFQRFKRKFTLKEHLKTHTGEKPFCCPVKLCGKTFTTSGNLARHKRLHPWLKPQVCLVDGCDKAFSNEVKLERHMKTHFKGPRVLQPCRVLGCGKQFSTTGNLMRHMKHQHQSCSESDEGSRWSMNSSCSVEGFQASLAIDGYDRICFDASRAFNPTHGRGLGRERRGAARDALVFVLKCWGSMFLLRLSTVWI